MKTRPPLSWVLLVALVLATLLAACREPAPLRFPHEAHLSSRSCGGPGQPRCLSCSTCHSPSQDRAHSLPDIGVCQSCHRGNDDVLRDVLQTAPERPYGEIEFNHDRHLKMTSISGQCVPCHGGVFDNDQRDIPPMAQCFSCHEHQEQWERAQCTPCHAPNDVRRIMPETFLRHDASFMRRHGQLATLEPSMCQSCHSQSSCDDCHDITQDLIVERRRPDQIERSFVHRGDFMTRHAIEAQSQPSKCARCHTPESCESCHLARGVSATLVNARSPHPPGWVGTNPAVRTEHGRQARRDAYQCATCHEQGPATNCIRCHRVGAVGGNPHPSGWRSSIDRREQPCRFCHEN